MPPGWQLCDGTHGTPDLQDRFLIGGGRLYPVGSEGGAAKVTLSQDEMPSHTHANKNPAVVFDRLMTANIQSTSNGGSLDNLGDSYEPNLLNSLPMLPAGGDKPHENLPPYQAVVFACKTQLQY